mmetsp:Transcript_23806/g.74405  ORF Transcript_23806/g.74405 Transcript_23806/m.74405 type:complete len:217 (+) Transcript_23806:1-651(+)
MMKRLKTSRQRPWHYSTHLGIGLIFAFTVQAATLSPRSLRIASRGAVRTLQMHRMIGNDEPVPRPAITMDRAECSSVRRVWALIFNPRTPNEGIYSQTQLSEDDDVTQLVLSFELEDDAERYAEMLTLQDMPKATPVEMETSTLLDFCDENGYLFGLIKRDQVVIPPEANVEQFEWKLNPSEEGAGAGEDTEEPPLDSQKQALERLFRAGDDQATG